MLADSAQAVAQVRRGATRLARRLRMERPQDALAGTKIAVLAHIWRRGSATVGEIAAAERLQPQSLTRVVAELETDQLIIRSRDERDRRQFVLELTEAGRAALTADMAARDQWLARAMAELTETERHVLLLAGRLMDRISGFDEPPLGAAPAKSAGLVGAADQDDPHKRRIIGDGVQDAEVAQ
jgi:DNA-binding MarR family transcriptional regulator